MMAVSESRAHLPAVLENLRFGDSLLKTLAVLDESTQVATRGALEDDAQFGVIGARCRDKRVVVCNDVGMLERLQDTHLVLACTLFLWWETCQQ